MKWVSKKRITIVILLLVLAGGGIGAYLYIRSKNHTHLTAEEVEAKLQAETAAKQAAEEARIQKLVEDTDTVEEVVALPEQDKSTVAVRATQKLAGGSQALAAIAIIDELSKSSSGSDALKAAISGYRAASSQEDKELFKQKTIEIMTAQGMINNPNEIPADYFDLPEEVG